jgi:hypothetical protein
MRPCTVPLTIIPTTTTPAPSSPGRTPRTRLAGSSGARRRSSDFCRACAQTTGRASSSPSPSRSDSTSSVGGLILELVDRYRPYLELDRWQIETVIRPISDEEGARAFCEAWPEYMSARFTFDPDRLPTGEHVRELVLHEMGHCHTWPVLNAGEKLADPEDPAHVEFVREAGERSTTMVSRAFHLFAVRLEEAETEILHLQQQLRESRGEQQTSP